MALRRLEGRIESFREVSRNYCHIKKHLNHVGKNGEHILISGEFRTSDYVLLPFSLALHFSVMSSVDVSALICYFGN